MGQGNLTALEILRHLDKTNCRECGENTCLAFASKVIQDRKKLTDCPYLDKSVAALLSSRLTRAMAEGPDPEHLLNQIKERVLKLDFAKRARELALEMVGDRLRVRVLGKIFDVDQKGDLHTLGHVNHWLHAPLLLYILESRGIDLVGQWVPYSSLNDVEETAPFFEHFCEKALERLADEHTDLFINILEAFGKPIDTDFVDADYTIELMPLPKVPFLFSYWKAEGDFPSKFALYFDRSIDENLDSRSILFLASGMAEMFSRFIDTHNGKQ